jgi:hypothetical protein
MTAIFSIRENAELNVLRVHMQMESYATHARLLIAKNAKMEQFAKNASMDFYLKKTLALFHHAQILIRKLINLAKNAKLTNAKHAQAVTLKYARHASQETSYMQIANVILNAHQRHTKTSPQVNAKTAIKTV